MSKSLVVFALLLMAALGGPSLSAQDWPGHWADTSALRRIQRLEDTLGFLGHGMLHQQEAEQRMAACRDFIPKLVQALKTEHSFHYAFPRLDMVSILYPPDSSFRIFTWQLFVSPDEYRYYGAIQMNSARLQLFPLIDRSFEADNPAFSTLPPQRWYGALYYNIRPFDTPEGPKYLLFGYDAQNADQRQKLLDVLSFDAQGQPQFGAPVFLIQRPGERQAEQRSRFLLEYSSSASVSLNFSEEENMIIFDHVTAMSGGEGGVLMVPDGTYEGFQLNAQGQWQHLPQLYTEWLESAPRPEPVLGDGKKGRGLFGGSER